jgi:DNA polymerase elongation subunit (family B)
MSMFGEPLRHYSFKSIKDQRTVRDQMIARGIKLYESDIAPAIKVLSAHYYGKPPSKVNTTFLDIEVDYDTNIGYSTVSNPYAPINAISLHHDYNGKSIVLLVPPPGFNMADFDESLRERSEIRMFEDEHELLEAFLNEIEDSDLLIGWNSNLFDFPYIARRLQIIDKQIEDALAEQGVEWALDDPSRMFNRLSFHDAKPPVWYAREVYNELHDTIITSGRMLGDYLQLYKKFEQGERESFKLAHIASLVLPELPKLEYEGSLADLYRNNFNMFVSYNIRDTEILKGFERKLGYAELATHMYQAATGEFKNVVGTVRLADYSIMNFCHHELGGVRVPDIDDEAAHTKKSFKLQGAYVLDPQVGIHDMVSVIDVKSLYPSSILTVNISPEKLIGQFVETIYAAEQIALGSDVSLTMRDEASTNHYTETAATWKKLLQQQGWAISGYGTVFNQDTRGIIPQVIASWFKQRGETNAQIKEIQHQIDAIASKYQPVNH